MSERSLKVLIAVDETTASVHAVQVASRLFGADGVEYLAIRVTEVPGLWGSYPYGIAAPIPGDASVGYPPPDAEGVSRVVERAGVDEPEVLLESGDPVDRICAAAEEHDVDVIVVGSHHKGFLGRLVDPSVSEGLLRSARRPLLVVGAEEPEEP